MALVDGSIDTVIAGLLTHAAGQIEVLKDSLRNITMRARLALDLEDNECTCTDKSLCTSPVHLTRPSKELEEEIYKELLKIIAHHKAIVK